MLADLATQILLGLLNSCHLMATVAWIGGIVTNALVLMPSAQEALPPPMVGKLMGSVMKRFRFLVYLSIVTFLLSGILMTLLDPNYVGLLDLGSMWAVIILIKHVVVAIFIYFAIYAFEVLAPKVAEAAAKGPSPELARLQKRQMRGAKMGFVLAIVIIILTGFATAL